MLYVGGTFKSASTFFHLLFTIHGLSKGDYVPLAFFLLCNEQKASYEDVFKHTAAETATLGVNVYPKAVNADFVTTIPNAVATVWPSCEVEACIYILDRAGGGK